jgi:indole-3-glycerol phosphate synthase
MKTILDTIIERKRDEIAHAKSIIPLAHVQALAAARGATKSLVASLTKTHSSGIIAEFKRKSPSKGWIQEEAVASTITHGYAQLGAAGISVLTDSDFFGGSLSDLVAAATVEVPVLRKEFIIDPYQIWEARAYGADVILLIAACLPAEEVESLAALAVSLDMEVLLEIHEESELNHVCADTQLVGINNRNLKTFEVDIENSLRLATYLPGDKIKIAESGIDRVEAVHLFRQAGFQGFLMGEVFMKTPQPQIALASFIQQLNTFVCE